MGGAPLGWSPRRRQPRLTGTGRALKVEDGLQVVGLVELQVERVLPLWESRVGVRWQLLDQPPPAATLSPAQHSMLRLLGHRTPAHGGTQQSSRERQRMRRKDDHIS